MTRWHHLDCFSFDSVSVSSADSIRGFDSLKSYDQDALKKLIEKREQAKNRDEDNPIRDEQEITKKKKVKDKDKNIAVPEEQRTPKKVKPAESEYAKAEAGLAAPDIKDKYKGSTLPPKWKAFHTVIFLEKDDGLQDASKIAAFDFDGCLAKTSVKRVGADAWSLMYPSVPDELQKLYADGFKLVIFTNECNIDRWRNKRQTAVDSKIGRLNNFLKCVSVPMQVFIACGFDRSGVEDAYRKPKAGMWHVMEKHFNSGISVDMDQSFYVGDAAGRENDHSDADIKFAQAIGLKFCLPEEFFIV